MTVVTPRLTVERRLLRENTLVVALDEVGRGALAGPVAVGAAAIDAACARRRVPEGLRDSKLVTALRRPAVAERAAAWALASSVGWASAAEVDAVGIMRALGLAAVRALEQLPGAFGEQAIVVLDGNYDYVSPVYGPGIRVTPIIKADRDLASAAAASVIAKVARDAHMTELHTGRPEYDWAANKGYASPMHRAAIRAHGLSEHHRRSWAIADVPTLF